MQKIILISFLGLFSFSSFLLEASPRIVSLEAVFENGSQRRVTIYKDYAQVAAEYLRHQGSNKLTVIVEKNSKLDEELSNLLLSPNIRIERFDNEFGFFCSWFNKMDKDQRDEYFYSKKMPVYFTRLNSRVEACMKSLQCGDFEQNLHGAGSQALVTKFYETQKNEWNANFENFKKETKKIKDKIEIDDKMCCALKPLINIAVFSLLFGAVDDAGDILVFVDFMRGELLECRLKELGYHDCVDFHSYDEDYNGTDDLTNGVGASFLFSEKIIDEDVCSVTPFGKNDDYTAFPSNHQETKIDFFGSQVE